MKTFRLTFALFFLIPGGPAFAQLDRPMAEFLSTHGCTIGPSTRALAAEAGYPAAEFEALFWKALTDPETVRTGEWLVLPSQICRIRPTVVPSELRLTDPDVRALISGIDDYAWAGFYGCFLFGEQLVDKVKQTRGWNDSKALIEWIRFAAEGFQQGTLAFYGTDPDKPPPGLQVLTDKCANIPEIGEIRRSQAVRDREFDPIIRANASDVVCRMGRTSSEFIDEIILSIAGAENTNVWMSIEIAGLGLASDPPAAGDHPLVGMLRPPFCHFE